MKRRSYVLIILLIFFILIVVTFTSFIFLEFKKTPDIKARSYLEIDLSGDIYEKAESDFITALFGIKPPLSMYDIWRNIQKAKHDSRIKSLVLRLGVLRCDWAKIEEIRQSVLDFRKSGKKAFAYIGEAMEFDKEYYLATACDRIIIHPLGTLIINGIGGYVPFIKNTLDKIGIEAEFEHVEEYKTAANMFTEEGFTPAHRKMMESLYGNIFDLYIKGVAEARGKSEEEVRRLIDLAFFRGEEARKTNLVDDLFYEDELENLLRDEGHKTYRISHSQYTKIPPSSIGLNKGKKIAVIYGMGPIHTGTGLYQTMGSTSMAQLIKRARKDVTVSGVIFRVDSPGGSAVGSDVIWREIELTKAKKPVVVSMSDVAGSGGYWVAMNAHRIVAQPQTLTGSIGVVAGKFNMAELFSKLGVTAEKVAFGKRADMFTFFRGLTQEERTLLKNEILWIYDKFITKVARGRNLDKDQVNEIGNGRVWTGQQAKMLGLVDETGGLSKAIELVKELAEIPEDEDVKLVVWPKKPSFFETVFRRRRIAWQPGRESRLKRFIQVFELLQDERTLALMPFWEAPK
ncbi:MAG: signal peptide peptidase SppA [Candidatus Aminicenantes bacterium]|jgi:protease-4